MKRRALFALVAVLGAGVAPAIAQATPAEIVIVLDTSASMAEPSGGPDGETKLDVAARAASAIAASAAEGRHRVGLVRFRQIDQVVMSGEGPRIAHVEDEMQCRLVADLLVPIASEGATATARWTDRVESADNPEVVALGDSPLYGAVRAALRYIRARRGADPATSCVNAFVVVITDGRDTCATGSDLDNVLGELRAQSVDEDIRGLVLAFDVESEASDLIARLGHEDDAEARPFAPDELDDLLDIVGDIEGRLAPEACVVSGVAPEDVGLPPDTGVAPPPAPPPPPGTEPPDDDDDGGCNAARGSAGNMGVSWILAGLFAVWILRRSRLVVARRRVARAGHVARLAVALALVASPIGCGDDASTPFDAGPATDGDAPADAAADVTPLVDPSSSAEADLARLDGLVALVERVRRDHLAPTLEPERLFDALEGEPEDACATLTRSFGYEPYVGTQQGVRGCLATRRCNSLDAALVLQACLDHAGIPAEVRSCRASAALRPMLAAESAVAAVMPDTSAAEDALREGAMELLADTPGLFEQIEALVPDMTTIVDLDVTRAVEADVDALLPIIAPAGGSPIVSAASAAIYADSRADIGHRTHHYLALEDGTVIDPVLDAPALPDECTVDAPVVLDDEHATVRAQILVTYADVTPTTLSFGTPVPAGEITWDADELWGELASVAIVDASERTMPDGLPTPARSSCLRAVLSAGGRTVVGDAFFLQAESAADCAGVPVVEVMPARHLAAITLRTEVTVAGETSTIERVLVDRYGYAFTEDGAHASGPMISTETAKSMMTMRVDLLASSGLPGPHTMLDLALRDVVEREVDHARRIREEHAEPGAPVDPGAIPEPLAKPFAWTTVAAFTRHVADHLPAGAYLLAERPWRIGVVRRRAFVPAEGGLVAAPVSILDIHEMPQIVVDPAARGDATRETARLAANVTVGVLVTEAERLAIVSLEGSRHVVHAGEMLRSRETGTWAPYGTGAHGSPAFPLSVRTAHRNRMLNGEVVVTTAGAVDFGGGQYIGWWRVDERTGHALGEIRYDGTFYGGAVITPPLAPTVVGAFTNFSACLWGASILSLQDGRTVPDVACCEALAFDDLAQDMLLDFGLEVVARLTDDGPGGRPDVPAGAASTVLRVARIAEHILAVQEAIEDLSSLEMFYESLGTASACVDGG